MGVIINTEKLLNAKAITFGLELTLSSIFIGFLAPPFKNTHIYSLKNTSCLTRVDLGF
jgi:hypothetical protein